MTPAISKERVADLQDAIYDAWKGRYLSEDDKDDLLFVLDEYALQSAPETKDVGQAAPSDEERKGMLENMDRVKRHIPFVIWDKIRTLIQSSPATPHGTKISPNVGQSESDAVSRGKDDIPGKEEK